MRCASVGSQARGGGRIDARELGVQRRPAFARGARHRARARTRGIGARQRRQPSVSALKYSIVPPTSSGSAPRARMSRDRRSASRTKARRRIRVDRIEDVDQVVRDARARRRVGLGGADVHAAIDLRRIDADDLAGEALGERQRRARSCRTRSGPSAGRRRSARRDRASTRDCVQRPRMNSAVEVRERQAGTTSAGRGCTGRRARWLPSRAAARSSPARSGCGWRAPRAWQAIVDSSSSRRAVSTCAAAEFAQVVQHRARERRRHRRRASSAGTPRTASVAGPSADDLEAERGERRRACSSAVATSSGVAANVAGTSSGCTGTRASSARLQPLVDDALVRRVHVDQHQPGAVLREDVDAVQLREREAERMRHRRSCRQIGAGRRACASRAPNSCRVERRGLGGAERHRRLARRVVGARRRAGAIAAIGASGTSGGTMRARRRPSFSAADTAGCSRRGRRQRALDRVEDELVDRAGVAKAHLDLLRMHVDVDAARIERRATARTPAGGRGAARRGTPRAPRAPARGRARSGR